MEEGVRGAKVVRLPELFPLRFFPLLFPLLFPNSFSFSSPAPVFPLCRFEHKLRKMLVGARDADDVLAMERLVEEAQMAGARRQALDMYRWTFVTHVFFFLLLPPCGHADTEAHKHHFSFPWLAATGTGPPPCNFCWRPAPLMS